MKTQDELYIAQHGKTSFQLKKAAEQHLIKDTKKRTAQRHDLIADILIYTALTLMGLGIAFALADVIFGAERVTEWLAALVI